MTGSARSEDSMGRLQETLEEEAGHDCLARAGIVGEQEARLRLRQYLQIDRLNRTSKPPSLFFRRSLRTVHEWAERACRARAQHVQRVAGFPSVR